MKQFCVTEHSCLRHISVWSDNLRHKKTAHNKLDCKAGTLRISKVKTVTSPKAPAANHSGTAAIISNTRSTNHELYKKSFLIHDVARAKTSTSCLWL